MVTRKRWQELAVVLLIIVPLMALIWVPILTSDTKPCEAGDPIPAEPPSKDRRVHNETGFSIIAPPNWTVRNRKGMVHLTPKQVFDGRSKAGILVSLRHEEPGGLREAEAVEFLGEPAHLKVERRPSTFDDPALTTWTYIFQRNGQWLEASYFIADSHEQIPKMALRYMETLKTAEEE